MAVPACEVEGVPEHDVVLDQDCICHWIVVVVAATPKGDFDTRHMLSVSKDMMHHNYKHLELQSEIVNDAHGRDDF